MTDINTSDKFLRHVFDSIEDYAIFTTDPDGVVTTCNDGITRLLGYPKEKFLGRNATIIFTPENRRDNIPEIEMEAARRTGRAMDDRWHVREDGSRVWVNGIMTDLRDDEGRLLGYVKVMRDRTEEHRTQEALRESEAKYRSLLDDVLDTSAVGVIILDAEFEVVWVNLAIEHYFGVSRERVLGKAKRELIQTHFGDVVDEPADFAERLLAAYRSNSGEERFEVHVRATDGSGGCWLEHRSQPIPSGPFAGGRIEQYYDITERKRGERALADARDALDSQVRERTADLLAVNEELESFNYSVSHDLRAPLRGLTGFSQILADEYSEQLDEKGRHYLERVSGAAERMGELIDALLALSRVARSELRIEDVDLSDLADRIASALRDRDPDRPVELIVEPGVRARGDERLLRVALENLLGNAWKFSRENAAGRIEFGVDRSTDGDVFFVRDNGAGFDMAFVDKLFTPFQRLHSPRDFAGTGIGLATVQRIVNRHSGNIWGEGKVGSGATFYFTLPGAQPGAARGSDRT